MATIAKVIEGSLADKLPTAWTDDKQRWEGKKKEYQRRESLRRKEIQVGGWGATWAR